MEVDKLTQNEI